MLPPGSPSPGVSQSCHATIRAYSGLTIGMDPRAAEQAAERVERARQFFHHTVALAALTLVAAAAAAVRLPTASFPFAILAAIEIVVVIGAYYGQRDLIQRLALEPEAARVPAVQRYHARLATQPARARLAASINSLIADARLPHAICLSDRVALVEDQLRWLARELITPDVAVQPRSLVACMRLLTHGVESPLFNPRVPVEQLHATLLRIRFGFGKRAAG